MPNFYAKYIIWLKFTINYSLFKLNYNWRHCSAISLTVVMLCVCTKIVCVCNTELVCKVVRLALSCHSSAFPFPLFLFPEINRTHTDGDVIWSTIVLFIRKQHRVLNFSAEYLWSWTLDLDIQYVQLKFLLNSNVKGFCIIINFFLSVFMLNFGFNPTIKKSQKLKLKCLFSSLPCNEMYEDCKTVFKLYEYLMTGSWKTRNSLFLQHTLVLHNIVIYIR